MSSKKNEETNANIQEEPKKVRMAKNTLFSIKRAKDGGYNIALNPNMSGAEFISVLAILEGVLEQYQSSEPKIEKFTLPC